jgi:SAM-dependent methyltransferase
MSQEVDKKPQVPQTYDDMFLEGGHAGVFDLPYRRSPYFPMFRGVVGMLQRARPKRVLEVGCGTGPLAHMLLETTKVEYLGFDFSPVAVGKAKARTARQANFFIGDATQAKTYKDLQYDAIVCTEVLEHIEDDLQAVRQWAAGTYCVCSVPNYDADTHVRHFKHESEVLARYSGLIDIDVIQRRSKPFLDDLSIPAWLQALRWNRYRPQRLVRLMGWSNFDRNGGWFIFGGRRRAH